MSDRSRNRTLVLRYRVRNPSDRKAILEAIRSSFPEIDSVEVLDIEDLKSVGEHVEDAAIRAGNRVLDETASGDSSQQPSQSAEKRVQEISEARENLRTEAASVAKEAGRKGIFAVVTEAVKALFT